MTARPIVDAHAHIGEPGSFLVPQSTPEQFLGVMDKVGIGAAVLCDHRSMAEGCGATLNGLARMYERSEGRLHYLAVYHPDRGRDCLAAMEGALGRPGLVGLKLHPSSHGVPAEDARYADAWRFASETNLAVLAHSWSVSPYSATQALSTPERFERYVARFGRVRFVLGHAGGRGSGRTQALRMVREHPNVYVDFAGDIFCRGLVESLVAAVSANRVLFASDFPWIDPRANLSRVLLGGISDDDKARILWGTAAEVYGVRG